jgi:hypothetical protein
MPGETESNIQRTICDYLALKRYFFWRQNTAPAVQKTGDHWAFRRMPPYSMKGVPDIILIDGGHFVGLEVKTPTGRQSPEQKEFQRRLTAEGGSYHVVRSVDDVIALGL